MTFYKKIEEIVKRKDFTTRWYLIREYFTGWGFDEDGDVVIYAFGFSFTIYKDGGVLIFYGDKRVKIGTKSDWNNIRRDK